MLSTPAAPAPAAMARTARHARSGARSPGAMVKPTIAVKTASIITPGFVNVTKSARRLRCFETRREMLVIACSWLASRRDIRLGRRATYPSDGGESVLFGGSCSSLGDQSRAALAGEIRPEPLRLYTQPVLRLGKRHDVQQYPDEPREKAAGAEMSTFQDGEVAADDGNAALVAIAEWPPGLPALELPRDQASDIASLLDGRLRHARHRPSIARDRRCVADDEHIRHTRDVEAGADRHAACAVRLAAQQLRDRRGGDARGPQHRGAVNSRTVCDDAFLVDRLDLDARQDLDAELLEPPGRPR